MDDKAKFRCDMKNLCVSCVLYRPPFECCYQELLLTQRECNFAKCFFTPYCAHANLKSFKAKEERLLKAFDKAGGDFLRNRASQLPIHFVPEIMPMKKDLQRAMSIIKDLDIPMVALSLQNFFQGTSEKKLLRKARRTGLHQFLDYSGEIILTTDVKDSLCDRFVENPLYFRALVEQLKPNYLTTFDTYTYSNLPAGIARIKMLEVQLSMHYIMDLDCKIIGLALGATPDQVYGYVEYLRKLGFDLIAHPVYLFRKRADTDSIRWRIWLSRKLGAKVLLLSCSPGLTYRMRVYADYYSTWSWFSSVNSKDGNANKRRKAKLQQMIELAKICSEQTKL